MFELDLKMPAKTCSAYIKKHRDAPSLIGSRGSRKDRRRPRCTHLDSGSIYRLSSSMKSFPSRNPAVMEAVSNPDVAEHTSSPTGARAAQPTDNTSPICIKERTACCRSDWLLACTNFLYSPPGPPTSTAQPTRQRRT